MADTQPGPGAPRAVVENIEAILSLEDAALHARTRADRVADEVASFIGTLRFALLQVGWFFIWALLNTGVITGLPAFDPYPFQLLCLLVSLEGVLLSTFVLIKQNRMSYLSDRRDHLDLQINLLAEREVTRLLQLSERIASHLGIEADVRDAQAQELTQETAVSALMGKLDEKLSEKP